MRRDLALGVSQLKFGKTAVSCAEWTTPGFILRQQHQLKKQRNVREVRKLSSMENENQNDPRANHAHAEGTWFGMSPVLVLGALAILVAVSFYLYNGGFGSRVATTPMSPTTTISPTTPTGPSAPTTR
jgi:hypothetical protein